MMSSHGRDRKGGRNWGGGRNRRRNRGGCNRGRNWVGGNRGRNRVGWNWADRDRSNLGRNMASLRLVGCKYSYGLGYNARLSVGQLVHVEFNVFCRPARDREIPAIEHRYHDEATGNCPVHVKYEGEETFTVMDRGGVDTNMNGPFRKSHITLSPGTVTVWYVPVNE
jgi:hypothetical protein